MAFFPFCGRMFSHYHVFIHGYVLFISVYFFMDRPSNSMYYEISLQKKKLMLSVHTQKKFSLIITLKDVLLLNHFTSSFSTSYYFHTKNLEPLLRIITSISYMKIIIFFSAPLVNFLSFLICSKKHFKLGKK